jgi:cytochrome c oxidase cbb3-type subunit III
MFKRVVVAIEILALVAAIGFVIALFVYDPDTGAGGGGGGDGEALTGAEIYAANCATCHGPDGGGGTGPQLSDSAVVEAYPDPVDEAIVVNDGINNMPAFEGRLSPEEIAAVVEFTRTGL